MSFAQLFPRRSFLDGNIMQKEDNGSSNKIKVAKKTVISQWYRIELKSI